MILGLQQGLKEDGIEVSLVKLCQWFGVARRTVYYRVTKGQPRRLPCQVDSSKLETSCLNILGLNAAGGTSPRDSWGRYSL